MRCQGAVSYVAAKRWLKRFRNADYCLKDDRRSERPMEMNLAELKHPLDSESNQSTSNIEKTCRLFTAISEPPSSFRIG